MRIAAAVLVTSLILAGCDGEAPETMAPEPAVAPAAAPTGPSFAELEAAAPSNPLKDAYFGNLHVHSGWSFDATTNGSITTPDSAYRWAKGEAKRLRRHSGETAQRVFSPVAKHQIDSSRKAFTRAHYGESSRLRFQRSLRPQQLASADPLDRAPDGGAH